ncbi:Co2+/Mg2+ efflux protein ApaG [Candidatus Berkiella cookevillensis]|uniref:Protein ApaG n=1 Tax=Candidatus Berkiella cookevillensis TaxID=437022 RepID=A0A0Q9YG19_9GAMM|nr:Co2+/Mg2+ efflux protein ApaG [Candidatus Berkiella cookevillensis]MCS5707481.1 Co2+/Mg2+ efflux protein ApaG [Candidatus Berkiella cookevillensis]
MPTSHIIQVTALAEFLSEHSDASQARFAFSYTITISNRGNVPARLLTRHWIITDANGKVQEVHGKGVIGEQPLIQPGRFFRYTSGTLLSTPVGTMQGSYEMITEDGVTFDAIIQPFRLAMPELVH